MDYSLAEVNEMAHKVRNVLKNEDFYTLYRRYQIGKDKTESYGFLGLKTRIVTEWETIEDKVANMFELRRVLYKQYEFGYNGVETECIIFAISEDGKLISISAKTTVDTHYQPGKLEYGGDIFPVNYPGEYTINEMTEEQMSLFNYEFISWNHKTNRFDEWGYGSKYLPQDNDIDNRSQIPYGVYGLKPGRIYTGKNEGLFVLLQSIFNKKQKDRESSKSTVADMS